MEMSLQLVRPAINHLRLSRQLPRYREESEDIGRPRTEDMALRIQVYLSQVGPSYYLYIMVINAYPVSSLQSFWRLLESGGY
jgi:hypothetical protein